MFAYVARQPVLDSERQVFGYKLLFREGKKNSFPDGVEDSSRTLAAQCLSLGLEDLCYNKSAFIHIHHDSIVNRFPTGLDPKSVVVELALDAPRSQSLAKACGELKQQGYRIAMQTVDFGKGFSAFAPVVDMLVLDSQTLSSEHIEQQLPLLRDKGIALMAEQVNTHEDFRRCRNLGFDYFQGYFFAKPEVVRQKSMSTFKVIMLELLQESAGQDFDLDKLTGIFEKDAGLAYMLLRFINNPSVSKREKITSLRHALTYLGQVELKKFVALLALANLGEDKPTELLHLSLVRAKFCDLLALSLGHGADNPKGFMLGLLSLLDAILDQSMTALLLKLPVVEDIKHALSAGQGALGSYIALVKALESGSWMKVIELSKLLELDQREIHNLFNQAIVWGNGIRQALPEPAAQD